MPQTYGPLPLPVPVPSGAGSGPGGNATLADPLIDTLLGFFQTILNAKGGAAWASVGGYQAGGNGLVVVSTFSWNPEDEKGTVMNSRDLPALFMWREDVGDTAWRAADYYVRPSELHMVWIPPSLDEDVRSHTRPFLNAIASIIDGVTDPDGRDPSYKVAGDTDPAAAYLGSMLWKQTPGLWSFNVKKAKPSTVKITTDSGEVIAFPCVRMVIAIEERNTVEEPPDNYLVLGGADLVLSFPGSSESATGGPASSAPISYSIELGVDLVGINPTSGPVAGGTPVTLLGVGFDDAPSVFFGPTQVPPAFVEVLDNGTTIIAPSPATSGPGAVTVTVTNGNGDSSSLPSGFSYF